MKLKHRDPVITSENPFENCALGRSQYADTLTNIVKNYADGFVLAINSEWGTGKTTFVKMWERHLQNEKFQTLYFNAWENDFETNPLIAFLAELKKLVGTNSKEQFKNVLQKGAVIVKNIAPVLVKAVADKYLSTDVLKEVLVEGTKGVSDILEDEIKDYTKKKEGIEDFRISLEKFVEALKEPKPIVFIIDELDRCRPTYAVELLEQIKHFFSVPGIVFVLSIDKEQLGHAVRGAYGSDRLNADEYLRRFIDIEYTIPKPDVEAFVRYLYKYFEFDSFLLSKGMTNSRTLNFHSDAFINFSSILFNNYSSTLRQQEKLFAQIRLIISFYRSNPFVLPNLLVTLIFFKNFIPDFYEQLRNKRFTIQELLPALEQKIPKSLNTTQARSYVELEAALAYSYYTYSIKYLKFELLTTDDSGKSTALINSKFDNTEGQVLFVKALKDLVLQYNYSGLSLEDVFDKIELIQNTNL